MQERQRATPAEAEAEQEPTRAEAARSSRSGATTLLQTKLAVGAADDPLEREADLVAAAVVRSVRSGGATALLDQDGLDQEDVRRLHGARNRAVGRVRRAPVAIGAEGGDLDRDTEHAIERSRSGGRPLDDRVRSTMEGALGADLGGIRVHAGPVARDLNDRIQARAFTSGSDIYFRDGLPDVASSSGQHLLAHELAHTVQQGAAPVHRSMIAANLVRRAGSVRRVVMRVFTPDDTSTYDDGPGSHALAQHGPDKPEEDHQARAKSNSPSYSSSGWASLDKMKSAVKKAVATRQAPNAKLKRSPNATKYYVRWTVNVTEPKCGFTWSSTAGADPVTKVEVDTAVVIFEIDRDTGDITRMVTAFPGDPAKEFNATA